MPKRAKHLTDKMGRKVTRATRKLTARDQTVPGPSPDPATNLIIHDLALRSAGRLARLTMEKGLLGRMYGKQFAKAAVENRSILHTLAAYGVTRVATRSLPGAAVVWGGLIAKTLFDRRKSKRKARRDGDKMLRKQAEPGNLV